MVDNSLYDQLINNLEEVIKVYRSLLQVVRSEKEILVAANLDDLTTNNKLKEEVLLKARQLEKKRLEITTSLAEQEKLESKAPSLLDLALHFQGLEGEKLRNLHAVLDLLTKRVKEINLFNENLIKSALNSITGAMKSIKDMLDDNKTYQKKGKLNSVQDVQSSAGQLVSKQV